jgi:predicted nucleotidyltransferase
MIPVAFTDEQLAALRTLRRIWPDDQIVLIGASALGCFLDMRWRQTYDMDLTVSTSVEEYATSLGRLPGWTRDPRLEHQWVVPGNVRIDIIPAGAKLLEAGEMIWPESGARMSLLGFRLAFEYGHLFRPLEDLELQVVPPPVLAVLKMVAFQDKPYERARDLLDLGHMIEEFLPEGDDRRFADEVFRLGLAYEQTSAFFLGKEIGSIVNGPERKKVAAFVSLVRDEADPNATLTRMAALGPASWRKDTRVLLGRLDAFERGLDL